MSIATGSIRAARMIAGIEATTAVVTTFDLTELRTLFLAGERCDPDTLVWAQKQLNVPVVDHWWQTETGWPIGADCVGLRMLPVKPGSCAKAVPGYDVRVLGERGRRRSISGLTVSAEIA